MKMLKMQYYDDSIKVGNSQYGKEIKIAVQGYQSAISLNLSRAKRLRDWLDAWIKEQEEK